MATKYGPSTALVSGVYARLVLNATYSPTSVTTSTSSVTVTWSLQIEMLTSGGYANDTASWSVSGSDSASGSKSWSLSGAGDKTTLANGTDVTTLNYGSTQTWTLDGSVNNAVLANLNMDPLSMTLPARPYAAPAAPTSFAVARSSDTRQNLSWTRNSTTAAPYTNIEVWRNTDGGSWSRIATLSGSATSYADTTTVANRRYGYRVRAVNSGGSSSYTAIDYISTTPAKPAAPGAKKASTGGGIVVTRGTISSVATHWEVWHAADGVWDAARLALVAVGTTTWTHAAPSTTQTHTYAVRAVSTDPTLTSAQSSSSATIQLISAPLAPTNLAPQVADATEPIKLTWTHNPVDTTPQRQYQIETRTDPTAAWTSLGVFASSASSRTIAANTWTNDVDREWRVYTWGESTVRSPASATAVISLSARPVVGIVYPEATHNSQRLIVQWSYFDPEGVEQGDYIVRLLQGGVLLWEFSDSGPATSLEIPWELVNGETYTVTVQARDGEGMWSDIAEDTFVVTYAPPPTPQIAATWQPDGGYVTLDLNVPVETAGQQPLNYVRVERLGSDGRWTIVADQLPGNGSAADMIPPLASTVTYRVVAVSVIGSEKASGAVSVSTPSDWVFINYGSGWGGTVKVWGNLQVARAFQPAKQLRQYAGRILPVVRTGTARAETYSLQATLIAPWADEPDTSSTWEEVKEAVSAGVVCVRDPEGTRIFATATGTDLSDALDIHRGVSIPLTVVDASQVRTT